MKLSLSLAVTGRAPTWEQQRELAVTADECGYEGVWVGEGYGWDAMSLLADLAHRTSRLKLGTGIVNVFSRSPALLAQAAATVDMLSGGRVRLGLGTSGPKVVEGWHGLEYAQALSRVEETINIIRLILSGEPTEYDGAIFRLNGRIRLVAPPQRSAIPIYLAAISPKAIETAGRIADGWLPAWVSPRHFSELLLPRLHAGAEQAGRAPVAVATCVIQNVFVGADRDAVYGVARKRVAFYIGQMGTHETNFYRDLFDRYGHGDVAEAIRSHCSQGRLDVARALVSDELIDLVATAGTIDECREKLAQCAELGIDELALRIYSPGDDLGVVSDAVVAFGR